MKIIYLPGKDRAFELAGWDPGTMTDIAFAEAEGWQRRAHIFNKLVSPYHESVCRRIERMPLLTTMTGRNSRSPPCSPACQHWTVSLRFLGRSSAGRLPRIWEHSAARICKTVHTFSTASLKAKITHPLSISRYGSLLHLSQGQRCKRCQHYQIYHVPQHNRSRVLGRKGCRCNLRFYPMSLP